MDGTCSTEGTSEISTKFRSKNLKGRDLSDDLVVYGRIILEWILRNTVRGCGLDKSG